MLVSVVSRLASALPSDHVPTFARRYEDNALALTEQLLEFPHIERLNLGPVSTLNVSWDQPHEGNMFEFLWKRRSIERAWAS